MSLVVWAEFAVRSRLPFFFSGIVVSLALTRSPYPVGIVYGADLLGAALGCLGALALLNLVSGPSAVLWIAALIAAGGLFFATSGSEGMSLRSADWRPRSSAIAGSCSAAWCSSRLANSMTDSVRPTIVKDKVEQPETIAYREVELVLARHGRAKAETAPPVLWGPSPRFAPEHDRTALDEHRRRRRNGGLSLRRRSQRGCLPPLRRHQPRLCDTRSPDRRRDRCRRRPGSAVRAPVRRSPRWSESRSTRSSSIC